MGVQESVTLNLVIEIGVKQDKAAGVYVSYSPSLDIYSQGTSESEAIRSIKDAVTLYLSTAYKNGLLNEVLRKISVSAKKRLQRSKQIERTLRREHFIPRSLPAAVPLQPALAA